MLHNLNTVGKDFVFEFAEPEWRQFAFSIKSQFGIMASFVGPYVGYYIYKYSGDSFIKSSMYVSGVYVISLIAFYILFYLDYTPGEIEDKIML